MHLSPGPRRKRHWTSNVVRQSCVGQWDVGERDEVPRNDAQRHVKEGFLFLKRQHFLLITKAVRWNGVVVPTSPNAATQLRHDLVYPASSAKMTPRIKIKVREKQKVTYCSRFAGKPPRNDTSCSRVV